jgi:Arc/MetJ-type ribon-helix-helix transcriptional regulator
MDFYRGFENASDAMREALEEYRSSRNGHNDVA